MECFLTNRRTFFRKKPTYSVALEGACSLLRTLGKRYIAANLGWRRLSDGAKHVY